MTRQAQGFSLSMIVIAAIALVVMVIVIALLINTGGDINQGVNSCQSLGDPNVDYKCVDVSVACGPGFVVNGQRGCGEEFTKCCMAIG